MQLFDRKDKKITVEHDINLNIHYSVPEELWQKIVDVFRNMPYWNENENFPNWTGDGIDLYASVEPSGIQIAGTMPQDIWNKWFDTLKKALTEVLGYDIGEPEDGFRFRDWKPFEKKYSDIKSVDDKSITFNDYSMFEWEDFENIEYNISAEPPCFVFKSEPYIELRLYFDGFSKKKNRQNLRDFNAKLNLLGLKTSGL